MTLPYKFDIERATRAADLLMLSATIREDDTLDTVTKDELLESIRQKFAQWNAATNPNRKGRWDPK